MDCLESHPDGVVLRTRVQPRAARAGIGEMADGRLRVRVSAPPAEGAANAATIKLLAHELGLAKTAVQLLRGARSREKDFLLLGASVGQIEAALSQGRS